MKVLHKTQIYLCINQSSTLSKIATRSVCIFKVFYQTVCFTETWSQNSLENSTFLEAQNIVCYGQVTVYLIKS